MSASLGKLGYLYVGTSDFKRDLEYYTKVLGAEILWNYHEFGANVAGLRLGEGPQYLLADHRPSPSCLPLFEVEDLNATAKGLRTRGWNARESPVSGPMCGHRAVGRCAAPIPIAARSGIHRRAHSLARRHRPDRRPCCAPEGR